MFREIHHSVDITHAIPPQSLGATGSGGKVSKIIDTAGFGAVEFAFLYGTVTATNATVGVTVKEGDVTGTLTTVTAANLVGGLAAAGLPQGVRASGVNKNFCTGLGYIGLKRYVQVTMAPTVSGGIIAGCAAILADPRSGPTSNGG